MTGNNRLWRIFFTTQRESPLYPPTFTLKEEKNSIGRFFHLSSSSGIHCLQVKKYVMKLRLDLLIRTFNRWAAPFPISSHQHCSHFLFSCSEVKWSMASVIYAAFKSCRTWGVECTWMSGKRNMNVIPYTFSLLLNLKEGLCAWHYLIYFCWQRGLKIFNGA